MKLPQQKLPKPEVLFKRVEDTQIAAEEEKLQKTLKNSSAVL